MCNSPFRMLYFPTLAGSGSHMYCNTRLQFNLCGSLSSLPPHPCWLVHSIVRKDLPSFPSSLCFGPLWKNTWITQHTLSLKVYHILTAISSNVFSYHVVLVRFGFCGLSCFISNIITTAIIILVKDIDQHPPKMKSLSLFPLPDNTFQAIIGRQIQRVLW